MKKDYETRLRNFCAFMERWALPLIPDRHFDDRACDWADVQLLDGEVCEMESNIENFKAAVNAAAPADSGAPLALRLGNVDGGLATLVARADAADVAAAASVAAAAAAAARDQIV